VLVVAVGAVTGGPWLATRLTDRPAPPPLTLSSSSAPAIDPDAPLDPDGTWVVADDSQAGYRIGETLAGAQAEVVGRTAEVNGSVTVAGGALTEARVTVGADSISTDQAARDVYFRRALNTTTYPQASFTLSAPVDVSAIAAQQVPVEVAAPGRLTIGGTTVDATATLKVQRTAGGLEVAGTIPVTLTDLGLTAPELPGLSVDPQGAVEVLLVLVRDDARGGGATD
jgi:polyisoprenoid-binding protein YceI